MESNTGQVFNLVSLYDRFQEVQDKRKPKGKRYALATILMGIFLAKLCGEDKPSGIAEWVRLREQWITQDAEAEARVHAASQYLSAYSGGCDR